MLERMIDKRPLADRLIVAELYGEARRRARWRELGGEEESAAVAALCELAGGRADLLAEVAGILEGAREGELDEPLARQAVGLCRKAGADPEAIPAWIDEGRRRAAAARQPPFSGGLHGGGARRLNGLTRGCRSAQASVSTEASPAERPASVRDHRRSWRRAV